MTKHHPKNERIKRAYLIYQRQANSRSEATIDAIAKALSRFDQATNFRDYATFHREQVMAFKRRLDIQTNARTDERLSRATVVSTLGALRAFFIWLSDQPGYRRKIRYSDADYFKPSAKDAHIAKAVRFKAFPTLEQVHHVLGTMPHTTDIERRDRALVAFTLLTGARDGALSSLELRHVNLATGRLDQDARQVKTKFSKTFPTWFFPVDGEARQIVIDWIGYLRKDLLWSDSDPLFPATRMTTADDGGFVTAGLERRTWSTAEPIRRIFKRAFETAGLPYFKPHSFRDTLVQLGQRICKTPEEFKAWSQNLGHDHVLTTLTSYGTVAHHRQAELIQGMGVSDVVESLEVRLSRLEQLATTGAIGVAQSTKQDS